MSDFIKAHFPAVYYSNIRGRARHRIHEAKLEKQSALILCRRLMGRERNGTKRRFAGIDTAWFTGFSPFAGLSSRLAR
jgi:hypothetical protein